ncbi:hypothetical protein ACK8P5_26060 (plasmid) [Paenibacillus sp. EC2-1]|uniref:hypothetical protein n=1 Tax=Paenibacillus sp. EC2-1 TaxID=3388665 RepID=UPI003BEEC7B9
MRIPEYATHEQIDANLAHQTVHRRIDLECRNGSSDKVYIILITENNNLIDCVGYYGRRGATLQSNSYGPFSTLQGAHRMADQVKHEKMNGRSNYTQCLDETFVPRPPMKSQQPSFPGASPNQGTVNDIVLGSMLFPDYDIVTFTEFEKCLDNDDYALEQVPSAQSTFSMLLLVDEGYFNAFRRDGTMGRFIEKVSIEIPEDFAKNNHGMILEAFKNPQTGTWSVNDIIKYDDIENVRNKPWNSRRAIMASLFEEMFPGVDHYDTSETIHLNDYHYGDTEDAYQQMKGLIVARNIHSMFAQSRIVTTKL